MTENPPNVGAVRLVGGAPCLDFCNTVGNHAGDQPNEHLTTYTDLVAWSRHAGLVAARTAQHLGERAERNPAEAARAFAHARELREALYRIFSAIATGTRPKAADLAVLNGALAEAMAHARVVPEEEGYRWDWARDENALDQMLNPIARSAADLLTSNDVMRLRECEGDDCGWLFLDTSKNHSRRWCAMNDCGNRAKARRHYARVRGER